MDVCVVGAGVIGATTAYHLARLGARVTMLDADPEPRGASAATFGWINANGKQPEHYFELNRDAMAAHEELARSFGEGTWLHGGGSVEWAAPEGAAALIARVEALSALGYPAEVIDGARLQALEARLAPANPPPQAAFFPSECWADTVVLIGLLLEAAQGMGAVVRRGVRVTRLDAGGDRRAVVVTDAQDQLSADIVLNCAGADAATLAGQAGLELETAGPPGLTAVTTPVAVQLARVVRAPGVHFRPETGGRLAIASPSIDAALSDGADTASLAERLVELAARVLPGIDGAAVDEIRAARRAIPPDGLPVVGRLADAPSVYHLVTHSGVTLAPLLGRLVADEIVADTESERLAPYRPARFAASLIS